MSVQAALRSRPGPRPLGLLVVMAAHVALVWLVANGLGLRMNLSPPPEPMLATVVQESSRRIEPSVPTPSTGPIEFFEVPRPEFTMPDEEPATNDTALVTAMEERSGSAMPEPRREPVTTDARHPLTQPAYPPVSIRFGEEGTATIELRVGIDGRVREARLLRSSGFPRLDAAALAEALRAWRLKPASVDGSPVEAWHAVRVSFTLDRR